jgi:CubicO group peptidase (beta-lactamase class C family)
MLETVQLGRQIRSFNLAAAVGLLVAAAAAHAQQAAPARAPASKAGAILTWPAAQREQYIAALDSFFLTRTVKAGPKPHVLDHGRPIAAFAAGGRRADDFDRFMSAERVRGVLVLRDGKVRLERFVPPHTATTRWNSFSIAKSITSTLVGAAIKDGYLESLDDPVTRYIKTLRGSAYDEVTVRQLLTMTSGVKWNEDYTDVNSDVARMYAQAPDPGFDMTCGSCRARRRRGRSGCTRRRKRTSSACWWRRRPGNALRTTFRRRSGVRTAWSATANG